MDRITVEEDSIDLVPWRPSTEITYLRGNNGKVYHIDPYFRGGGSYGNVEVLHQSGDEVNLIQVGSTPLDPGFSYPNRGEQHLKEIRFRNGSIRFEEIQGYLKTIKIFIHSSLSRQINFHYSACLLDSVTFKDETGKILECYRFGYHDRFGCINNVRGRDHWGYRTAYYSPGYLTEVPGGVIPVRYHLNNTQHFTYLFRTNGPARDSYGTIGILTSVTYPSGGRTEFTYEPHQYWDERDVTGTYLNTTGGARISEITDIDPLLGKKMIRRFKYGKKLGRFEQDGAGFIKRKITMDDYMTAQEVYYSNGRRSLLKTYFSDPVIGCVYESGSPVVYDIVTEFRTNYENDQEINLGKTIYRYNYYDHSQGTSMRIPGTDIYTDPRREWMYGQLLSQEDYKTEKGNYVLVSRKSNDYSFFKLNKIPIAQAYRKRKLVGYGYEGYSSLEDIQLQAFEIETGCMKLTSDTSTVLLDNGQQITTVTDYTYDNDVLLRPTVIQTKCDGESEGNVQTKSYTYLHDAIRKTGNNPLYQGLLDQWRINTVLENQTSLAELASLFSRIEYKLFDTGIFPEKIKNRKEGFPEETRIRFYQYDKRGNPVYAVQDEAKRVVYLWGYNYTHMIAEIHNATFDEVTRLISENTLDAISAKPIPSAEDWTLINGLRTSLPNAMVSTFTFKPMVGVASETGPDGITTTYQYDNFNRIRDIRDAKGNILKAYDYHYSNP